MCSAPEALNGNWSCYAFDLDNDMITSLTALPIINGDYSNAFNLGTIYETKSLHCTIFTVRQRDTGSQTRNHIGIHYSWTEIQALYSG